MIVFRGRSRIGQPGETGRRMSLIVCVVATVLWLGLVPGRGVAQSCGGLLQPPCPPPPVAPPPPAEPELATISLAPAQVTRNLPRGPIRLKFGGRVTGVNLDRMFVQVEVRSPEYGVLMDTSSTGTNPDGTYDVTIRTSVNATVRAYIRPEHQEGGRLVSGTSNAAKVRLLPRRPRLLFAPVGHGRVRFELRFGGPPFVILENSSLKTRAGPGRRGYFYVVPKGSRIARLIGSAPFRTRDCTGFCFRSARKTFTVTGRLARARSFVACARQNVWLGVGTGTTYRRCGRPRIRV